MIHYMVLVVGFILMMTLFYVFRYNYMAKIAISLALSTYYLVWGLAHHKIHERLNKEIALEYISFAVLVFVLLLAALNV